MKVLALFLVLLGFAYEASGQACHLREVDLCVATLIFHYQGSGIPEDEPGVESLCESIQETEQCLRNFTTKCTTPVQREIIELVSEGSQKTVKDFCTRGSEVRTKFIRHAPCLAEVHSEDATRDCMIDLQVTVETVTTTHFNKRVGTLCCGFRRFLECSEKLTEQKCGQEAVEMGRTLFELAITDLPNVVCNSFDPQSSQCKALLPAAGSTPKGTQASSQLARLLATALGS